MTTPDVYRDAEYIADVSGIQYGNVAETSPTLRDERMKKKIQSAAKLAFIDHLLRDLDILIYCELSALYYMDCSVVLFAIRAIVQLIFFTPKAPPFDPTRSQPFIGAIFGSNLFCILFHNFFSRPEAGEATRGYQHGGILIDFIGQKAPVPFTRLLFLDLLVMALDLVMLGLIVERVKTTESTEPAATTAATTTDPAQHQDHDHEERGVRRDGDDYGESRSSTDPTRDGIELGELASRDRSASSTSLTNVNNNSSHLSPEEQLDRTRLLADPSENGQATKYHHALDLFSSGDAVIMDMGLLDVIRDQWRYRPSAARRSPYAPSDQTAAFLRERFGLQVGADGRVERIAT